MLKQSDKIYRVKLFKSKKNWIAMGTTIAFLGIAGFASQSTAYADTVSTQENSMNVVNKTLLPTEANKNTNDSLDNVENQKKEATQKVELSKANLNKSKNDLNQVNEKINQTTQKIQDDQIAKEKLNLKTVTEAQQNIVNEQNTIDKESLNKKQLDATLSEQVKNQQTINNQITDLTKKVKDAQSIVNNSNFNVDLAQKDLNKSSDDLNKINSILNELNNNNNSITSKINNKKEEINQLKNLTNNI